MPAPTTRITARNRGFFAAFVELLVYLLCLQGGTRARGFVDNGSAGNLYIQSPLVDRVYVVGGGVVLSAAALQKSMKKELMIALHGTSQEE